MPLNELLELWKQFSTIVLDEDDCTESKFLHFDVGTDKIEIWEWFESKNESFAVHNMIGE